MNHWMFVTAVYAIAFVATGGLTLWAYASMRRAERTAEALKGDR